METNIPTLQEIKKALSALKKQRRVSTCKHCHGSGTYTSLERGYQMSLSEAWEVERKCYVCNGKGKAKQYKTKTEEIEEETLEIMLEIAKEIEEKKKEFKEHKWPRPDIKKAQQEEIRLKNQYKNLEKKLSKY